MGKMIPDAPEINLAPIHIRFGEGNGIKRRPTPYTATAKECRAKLNRRGFRPERELLVRLSKHLQGSNNQNMLGAFQC